MSDFASTHWTFPTSPSENVLLEELFAEMQQLNEQMKIDQADIDRLTAETRAISARTDERLLQIEALLDSLRKAN